jgi:hypothetical protein
VKLRVAYAYDDDAGTWAFHVPALHVAGGGDASRPAAEEHCMEAIAFTLEASGGEAYEPAQGDVVEYAVQLTPASR